MNKELQEKRRAGGRPLEEFSVATGDKILIEATKLFCSSGYAGVSVEKLAKRMKIAKRTFYARFSSKEELFTAVLFRLLHALTKDPFDISCYVTATVDAEEVLMQWCRWLLDKSLSSQYLVLRRLTWAPDSQSIGREARMLSERYFLHSASSVTKYLTDLGQNSDNTEEALFAVGHLMTMTVSKPVDDAIFFGRRLTRSEKEIWCQKNVRLFLEGYKNLKR